MVSCSVSSCSNNTNRNKKENVTFHSFPLNNTTILTLWLAWLGKGPSWQPTQWSKVCSEHFTPDSFTDTKSVRRLKNDAVPSILRNTGTTYAEADGAAMALLELRKLSVQSKLDDISGPPNKMSRFASDDSSDASESNFELQEAKQSDSLHSQVEQSTPIADSATSCVADLPTPIDKKVVEVPDKLVESSATPFVEGTSSSSSTPQLATMRTLVRVDTDKRFPVMSNHEKAATCDQTFQKGGGSLVMHDVRYTLLLAMLVLLRARLEKLKFKLAMEYAPAGKFDDIYLQFQEKDGSWHHFYFQVKHSENINSEIVLSDLIGDKRGKSGRLNLKDYFLSHLNLPSGNDKKLCILFTNKRLCHGNTMKNMTLNDEMFHKIYLEFPNIFTNFLLKFKNPDLKQYLKNITDARLEYIDKFFDEFALAVDQPNIEELKTIVFKEITNLLKTNQYETRMIYSSMFVWIQEWMGDKIGTFIDSISVEKFLEGIKPSIERKVEEKINTVPQKSLPNFCNRITEQEKVSDVLKGSKEEEYIDDIVITERDKVDSILKGSKDHKSIDIAITGSAGVGKTQLILKCIEKIEPKFNHILWINAESEDKLKTSFHELAIRLGIIENKPYSEMVNFNVILQRVYETLSIYKCLFIFDNASSDLESKMYLPSKSYESLIIVITSQFNEWNSNHCIQLDCFTPEDSVLFLEHNLINSQEEGIIELAEALGHHPLALQMAVSYIKYNDKKRSVVGKNYLIKEFLSEFEKNSEKFFEWQFSNRSNTSLKKLWDTPIENVPTEPRYGWLALKILHLIAFCGPEDIPVAVFENLLEKVQQYDLLEALLLLKRYSLIKLEGENISIHRLFQEVTRAKCETKKTTEIIEELLNMLLYCYKFSEQAFKFTSLVFRNHALKVWSYAWKYERLVKKYCELPVLILRCVQINEELSPDIAATLEKILGVNHPQYLAFQLKTAELLYEAGKNDEALKICESTSKDVQYSTVDIWLLKAKILGEKNKFQEATNICNNCNEVVIVYLGDKHPKSLKILRILRRMAIAKRQLSIP